MLHFTLVHGCVLQKSVPDRDEACPTSSRGSVSWGPHTDWRGQRIGANPHWPVCLRNAFSPLLAAAWRWKRLRGRTDGRTVGRRTPPDRDRRRPTWSSAKLHQERMMAALGPDEKRDTLALDLEFDRKENKAITGVSVDKKMWCDRWHIHTYYKVISGCISLTCRITRLVFLTGDYEKVPKHPNYMPGMRRSARLRRQQRRRMALIWRRRMKLMKLVGVPESRWVSQASSQRTVWRRTRTCRLSEFFFNTMVNDSQYKNADAIALVYNIMACSYTHNFIRHQRQQK